MTMTSVAFAQPATLSVKASGIESGKPIPEKFAYCVPDGKGKSASGGNISPEISWSPGPAGTKSYALIVVDKDVPTNFDSANKEGMTIPADMKRQNFYHWVVVNIPTTVTSFSEGTGKSVETKGWVGINDFASFMKDKPAQTFVGYDGPCPPWNDERLHHYHFIVHAMDVETLPVKSGFGGKEAEEAIKGHILASGEVVGTYTQNSKLPGK